jgi:hypothetical protein
VDHFDDADARAELAVDLTGDLGAQPEHLKPALGADGEVRLILVEADVHDFLPLRLHRRRTPIIIMFLSWTTNQL